MLGRHKNQVPCAFAGNLHARENERLGKDPAIDRERKQFAEADRVHIRLSESGLLQVLARARLIVVVRQHVDLRLGLRGQQPDAQCHAAKRRWPRREFKSSSPRVGPKIVLDCLGFHRNGECDHNEASLRAHRLRAH